MDALQQHETRISRVEETVSDLRSDVAVVGEKVDQLLTIVDRLVTKLDIVLPQQDARTTALETADHTRTSRNRFLAKSAKAIAATITLAVAVLGLFFKVILGG